MEEYQRRERTYDQAIIAYQKKIAEMLRDSHLAELEASNADYRRRLIEAQARIATLEQRIEEMAARAASRYTNTTPSSPPDSGPYRENTGSYADNTARSSGTSPGTTAPPPPASAGIPTTPRPAASREERIENIRQSSIDLINQLTQALNNR